MACRKILAMHVTLKAGVKHLEVRQIYYDTRLIFSSPLGVWSVVKHILWCLIYYLKIQGAVEHLTPTSRSLET